MRTESKTHNKIIKEVIKRVGGINTDHKTRVFGSYHPDIKLKDIDIEVEIFNNLKHIRNKWRRWDKKRKKILIVAIPDEVMGLFDEVHLWKDD